MVYYSDDDIVIRELVPEDAEKFAAEFTKQGWHPSAETYLGRLEDRRNGKCIPLAAEYKGEPAGYVNLYFSCKEGPFAGSGIPEIVDFAVLKKFQRKGVGGRLMDAAEKLASGRSDTVALGVGLCGEYGSAQRMYIKRGYIPDGSGIWYRGKRCVQYETQCTVDDDLVLYLSKRLR